MANLPSSILPEITPHPDYGASLARGFAMGNARRAANQRDRQLDQAQQGEDSRTMAARATMIRAAQAQAEANRKQLQAENIAKGDYKAATATMTVAEKGQFFDNRIKENKARVAEWEKVFMISSEEEIDKAGLGVVGEANVAYDAYASLNPLSKDYEAKAAAVEARFGEALARIPLARQQVDRLVEQQSKAHKFRWPNTGSQASGLPTAKQALLANEGKRENIDSLHILFNQGSVNDAMAALSQEGGGMRPELVSIIVRAIGEDGAQKLREAEGTEDISIVMAEFKSEFSKFAFEQIEQINKTNNDLVKQFSELEAFHRGGLSPNLWGSDPNNVPGDDLEESTRTPSVDTPPVSGLRSRASPQRDRISLISDDRFGLPLYR